MNIMASMPTTTERKPVNKPGLKDRIAIYDYLKTCLEKDAGSDLWFYKNNLSDLDVADVLSKTLAKPCTSLAVQSVRREMFGQLKHSPGASSNEVEELKTTLTRALGEINMLVHKVKALETDNAAIKLAIKHNTKML